VEIKVNTRVSYLKKMKGGNFEVKTKKGDMFIARNAAIATGNLAAPKTGSTDDGFDLLKSLGHTAKTPSPNIVPLATDAAWVHRLSGVTLSFMTLRFNLDGKIKLKKTGKVLFTHFGISGPLVLNSSFEVIKLLKAGQVEAVIDMFPDTEENELDRRVWRLFERNKNKKMKNVLPEMMDKAMAAEILNMPDIGLAEKPVNEVTKEERKKLVKKMKNLSFPIVGTLGFEKAVIADGGVILEEVNFKNMTSRLHPNLYLLGDILNINRPSGGFSLQLCWTTGYVAGTSVGDGVKSRK
jgi:predicted Rossmann fold flavoprotein